MEEAIKEDKLSSKAINKPLVFISHDTRDAELAEAFSNLLKSVSAGVLKSFRTSDKKGTQGIEYGVEWYPEIIKNIQEASDVVCLLTQNSVNRPWILFEAGMAKGKLNTPILGVTLGISLKDAITGPFAQFQNCGDDEESLIKLVFQLVDRIPNSEPDEETIKFQVGKFKSKVESILQSKTVKTSKKEAQEELKENSTAKLFEEIKMMFQDLPSKIQNNVRMDSRERRKRKIHPMMIEELCHLPCKGSMGLIAALSLYKETSLSWIYDVGIETIREIEKKKSISEKQRILYEFEEALNFSIHNSMAHELSIDSKDDYYLMREIPMVLIKNMHRILLKEDK